MKRLRRPPRPPSRVLIVAGPGIGDIFLSTPLMRSICAAYPQAQVDYLVRRGRERIVRDTPQISRAVVFDYRSTVLSYLKMTVSIFRRYDLAVSCATSDRATLSCFYAAPVRIGIVPRLKLGNAWKRLMLQGWVETDASVRTAIQNLRLTEVLGIGKDYRPVLPSHPAGSRGSGPRLPFDRHSQQFAVFHCFASGRYKAWPEACWREVLGSVVERNVAVVFTGSAAAQELAALQRICAGYERRTFISAGLIDFADILELLRGALFFLGIDTCTGHLAAACGAPTFVLSGPTLAAKWAPMPAGYAGGPLPPLGGDGPTVYGNVCVLQGKCDCPGSPEKCSKPESGYSLCLTRITPARVLAQLRAVLPAVPALAER